MNPNGRNYTQPFFFQMFINKYSAWTCSQELTRTCPILCHHCSRTTCRLWLRRYQKHSPPSPVALDQDPPRSGQCLCNGEFADSRSDFDPVSCPTVFHQHTKWLAHMQVPSQPPSSSDSLALKFQFQCSWEINC